MRLYSLGEIVGEFLWLVFGYVCYAFGRLVVPLLSAGFVRPAEARDEQLTFAWYGLARAHDGKAVLSDGFTIMVGLATLVMVIAAAIWVLNVARQPGA